MSPPGPKPSASEPMLEKENTSEESAPLPLLDIDMDDPLLLEDSVPVEDTGVAGADNAACLVCHANFADEFLARNHAEHDIGCVACHGDSFAHRNDENNTTPPDTMFPARTIDPFCQKCHKTHDVPAQRIVRRWQKNESLAVNPNSITCTHCHGQHLMKVRTVIWDKASGKLLPIEK